MAVLLRGYASMVGELAGDQWNEGDVSCSVVRRVALPDAFFATDGLFETFLTVLDEFGAYPAVIERELDRYLPFLATTKVLMAAVRAGVGPRSRARGDQGARRGGRAGDAREGAADNDLLDRLAGDPRLGLSRGAARRPDRRAAGVHRSRRRAGRRGRRPGSWRSSGRHLASAAHDRVDRPDRGDPVSGSCRTGYAHVYIGKVRDLYSTADGDDLLLVASDRISAYDLVLPTPIPDKGAILTRLSLWWFDRLADLVPQPRGVPTDVPAEFAGRAMLCRRLEMFPVECVVRGYLTGSGLADYQRDRRGVRGAAAGRAGRRARRLPEPIFTPATKAAARRARRDHHVRRRRRRTWSARAAAGCAT